MEGGKRKQQHAENQGLQPGTQFRTWQTAPRLAAGNLQPPVAPISYAAGITRLEVPLVASTFAHPQDVL